jgi:hypothetical protein
MIFLSIFVSLAVATLRAEDLGGKKHHHHKHHHKHHRHADEETADNASNETAVAAPSHALVAAKATTTVASASVNATEEKIEEKMKELEAKMTPAAEEAATGVKQGRIVVNGPLPTDFSKVFADAVAAATGCTASDVKILETHAVAASPAFIQLVASRKASAAATAGGEIEVVFEAPAAVVDEVEAQAADPESKLVGGQLHDYLVAEEDEPATPAAPAPMEIDTEMPYGELEPFGREDTAQELTDHSVQESDEMVDQLERAEVAEEKRAVFRALTRLRGAAITSYDGIARSQTGNIDEYNHLHKWRETHPLHHLADEESDVSKWAFPDNAD